MGLDIELMGLDVELVHLDRKRELLRTLINA